MIGIIRKNQRVFLILITILVIIAFVWLYNGVRWEQMGADRVAQAYGNSVSRVQVEQQGRKFHLALDLGLTDMVQTLAGVGPAPGIENFAWNLMVLQHEADRLRVHPTDAAVLDAIRALPEFQTNGQFDPQKYALFAEEALSPRGFSEKQLHELVRDHLRFHLVQQIVASPVDASPAELRELYERQFGVLTAQVVRFDSAQIQSEMEITEEELQAAYEQRKDTLQTEEQRRLKVARFGLSEDKAGLEGRERVQALQALADAAEALSVRALGEDATFEQAAEALGVTLEETEPFAQGNPPETIDRNPAIAAEAFELTEEQPVSGPIQGGGELFYVVKLEEIMPSRPLSFEEARERLANEMRSQRVSEQLSARASAARSQITAALEGGKTFEEAAREAGLQAEDFPAFSPAEPKFETPDAPAVMQTASTLEPGELSQPTPAGGGMVLVYLAERQPVDEAQFEERRDMLAEQLLQGKQMLAFAEWLRQQREAADIQVFGDGRR